MASTALRTRRNRPSVPSDVEQRFFMDGVSWDTYETVSNAFGEVPVRLTYDRGRMEFMTLSLAHEMYSELLNFFVRLLLGQLRMKFRSGGSTTFRRKDLDRGMEPDKCFWIKNYKALLGKKSIDLRKDPPADLALEVEITSGWLNRMGIYAALGIGEVWRFDGERIWVHRLRRKAYVEVDRSAIFPDLPMDEVAALIVGCEDMDEATLQETMSRWISAWRTRTGEDTP